MDELKILLATLKELKAGGYYDNIEANIVYKIDSIVEPLQQIKQAVIDGDLDKAQALLEVFEELQG